MGNNEWIKINERTPDMVGYYEVVVKLEQPNTPPFVDCLFYDHEKFHCRNDYHSMYYKVTHWRLLPELPGL